MAAVASSSRTSPELPSLSHTAASTSVSTSMPVSPTTDTPASKDATQQDEEEPPINVEELAEELKDGDESDPNVSQHKHTFGQPTKGGFCEACIRRLEAPILTRIRCGDCPFAPCATIFNSSGSCKVWDGDSRILWMNAT